MIKTSSIAGSLLLVLAAWKSGPFNAGAEYFKADNYSATAVVTGPEDTASGVDLALVYKTDDFEVGGTSTKANQFGIWTQLKF